MSTFYLLQTEFEIQLQQNNKLYRMMAKLAYQGDSVERWEVRAGEKLMYFENDRPARRRSEVNQVVKWKIIKGLEYIKDPEKAALLLTDIWQKIEVLSEIKPFTFQDVRAKR